MTTDHGFALLGKMAVMLVGYARQTGSTTQEARVAGTATYRERMALPPGAVLEVSLQDVSRADAAADVIGTARQENLGQPPFRFEIPYDPGRIETGHTYSVRARITHEGRQLFTTDQAYPVITQGRGQTVDVMLRRISAVSRGGSATREDAPLENTYWKVMSIGDDTVTVAEGQREPHFVLRPSSQQVGGYAGCNTILGKYELKGDELSFPGVASTMMACPQGMDTEKKFLDVMRAVSRWRIAGERLELVDSAGRVLARFERRLMG